MNGCFRLTFDLWIIIGIGGPYFILCLGCLLASMTDVDGIMTMILIIIIIISSSSSSIVIIIILWLCYYGDSDDGGADSPHDVWQYGY